MRRTISSRVPLLGLVCFAFASPALAHISLEKGGTHISRFGDPELKVAPCGKAGGRGDKVYTYAPGATITVSLVETIPHPSYFRIAFDDAGDDGFADPVSIDPIDKTRACPDSNPNDHCGASDFFNTPAVLMDNLNPHIPTAADFSNPKTFTWEVKLPNVECDTCTLQVIQVMEDDAFHGAYDVTPGVGVADVYHQCIDLVLKRPDGGAPGSGGAADGATKPGSAPASSGDSGGCSVVPSRRVREGFAWAALALAAGGLAARRRRTAR